MHTLPQEERYSYVFEGNSQVLDQILFSENMLRGLTCTTSCTSMPSSPTRQAITTRPLRA